MHGVQCDIGIRVLLHEAVIIDLHSTITSMVSC
jgi:hypothetical protein